ncbi:OLC1v1024914C1 [Oldenlandia corymbosa var. corymbosa]|uniref:Glycosyltransferase n=1 Tax=Oldenlandia corymbosa var. corymbosa TaxID=529605 RepID=A0AAV1C3M8_OLDCO|nr:OLC1v1024914C1 [Oldenlandia corymbosa var. corymbosa]
MANKVILVPYPAQGHVTPMLKLAAALLNHGGLAPMLVVPEFIHRRISPQIEAATGGRIPCVAIPDGLDDDDEQPVDFFVVERAMEESMPLHLQRLVLHHQSRRHGGGGGGVAFMVVDLLASYAINVGKTCGVEVVGFWPAMFATYKLIASIPEMVESGLISDDSGCPLQDAPMSLVPGQPPIYAKEMPWLIGTSTARKVRFKFWKRTFDRSTTLGSLLVNSFPEECNYFPNHYDSNEDLSKPVQIIPIWPINYGTNAATGTFWEEDLSCLEWLDNQSHGSVIYISFGSWVSPIGEAKVKALALGLEASKRPFLWVLGPLWRKGLPLNFIDKMTSKGVQGKIVSWAPQMKVLQHEAVGCYLTHCGWNSTMEAIECKKRLLCYPVAGDQFLNCAYIVNLWRIGVRLDGFGGRDLNEGIKKVMEDREMSERIVKLNGRLMGKQRCSRNVAALTTFVNSVMRR